MLPLREDRSYLASLPSRKRWWRHVRLVVLGREDLVSSSRLSSSLPEIYNFFVDDHDVFVHSYQCGGVGHLSRDCVQGSKCYNCSGIVRSITPHLIFSRSVPELITLTFYSSIQYRATSAVIARSRRSVPATAVGPRGKYRLPHPDLHYPRPFFLLPFNRPGDTSKLNEIFPS